MAILKALFIFKWLTSIKGQGTVSGGRQSRTWCKARCEQTGGSAVSPAPGPQGDVWSQPACPRVRGSW